MFKIDELQKSFKHHDYNTHLIKKLGPPGSPEYNPMFRQAEYFENVLWLLEGLGIVRVYHTGTDLCTDGNVYKVYSFNVGKRK